jgi:hypothetical protein
MSVFVPNIFKSLRIPVDYLLIKLLFPSVFTHEICIASSNGFSRNMILKNLATFLERY